MRSSLKTFGRDGVSNAFGARELTVKVIGEDMLPMTCELLQLYGKIEDLEARLQAAGEAQLCDDLSRALTAPTSIIALYGVSACIQRFQSRNNWEQRIDHALIDQIVTGIRIALRVRGNRVPNDGEVVHLPKVDVADLYTRINTLIDDLRLGGADAWAERLFRAFTLHRDIPGAAGDRLYDISLYIQHLQRDEIIQQLGLRGRVDDIWLEMGRALRATITPVKETRRGS